MARDVIVLGAGIVGVSIGIHLARRGRSVLMVDRGRPGRETSWGNGGIIQSEGMRPFRFPRDLATLMGIAANRSPAVRYAPATLIANAGSLLRYWWHSAPERYEAIARDYALLIAAAEAEHDALIDESGASSLVRRGGWIKYYRSPAAWETARREAELISAAHGNVHERLDAEGLRRLEPDLDVAIAGAIRWPHSPTIADPGALLDLYLALFRRLGGTVARGDAATLTAAAGGGFEVATEDGVAAAGEAVIALGPWAGPVVRKLGYRLPLFVKRGYHMHYSTAPGARLNNWLVDAEQGWLVAPMAAGIRLATGAEFAGIARPPSGAQLKLAEQGLRAAFPLGDRLDPEPWVGARPCTPDMKPVIGPAPRHPGLWFAFGHGHHGLTLGPVTGRLIAEAMSGEAPRVALAPFRADRFRQTL